MLLWWGERPLRIRSIVTKVSWQIMYHADPKGLLLKNQTFGNFKPFGLFLIQTIQHYGVFENSPKITGKLERDGEGSALAWGGNGRNHAAMGIYQRFDNRQT